MDRRIATAVVLSAICLALPRAALGAATCSADGAAWRVTVTGKTTATLLVTIDGTGAVRLSVNGRVCREGAGLGAIVVEGDGAAQTVVLDGGGADDFVGWTFDITLGGGADVVSVVGTAASESIAIEADSIDLDADGTPEVAFAGVETVAVSAGAGADHVDGSANDDPTLALRIAGGAGTDALHGGAGPDDLRGGDGDDDAMWGGPGDDALAGGRGIDRNGMWDCGEGADVATFDRADAFFRWEVDLAFPACEARVGPLAA